MELDGGERGRVGMLGSTKQASSGPVVLVISFTYLSAKKYCFQKENSTIFFY